MTEVILAEWLREPLHNEVDLGPDCGSHPHTHFLSREGWFETRIEEKYLGCSPGECQSGTGVSPAGGQAPQMRPPVLGRPGKRTELGLG